MTHDLSMASAVRPYVLYSSYERVHVQLYSLNSLNDMYSRT
jgi:hypothetical protein